MNGSTKKDKKRKEPDHHAKTRTPVGAWVYCIFSCHKPLDNITYLFSYIGQQHKNWEHVKLSCLVTVHTVTFVCKRYNSRACTVYMHDCCTHTKRLDRPNINNHQLDVWTELHQMHKHTLKALLALNEGNIRLSVCVCVLGGVGAFIQVFFYTMSMILRLALFSWHLEVKHGFRGDVLLLPHGQTTVFVCKWCIYGYMEYMYSIISVVRSTITCNYYYS